MRCQGKRVCICLAGSFTCWEGGWKGVIYFWIQRINRTFLIVLVSLPNLHAPGEVVRIVAAVEGGDACTIEIDSFGQAGRKHLTVQVSVPGEELNTRDHDPQHQQE